MKPIVAIVGRPNVGKSTLFNRLIGRKRAVTADEPGVTRDLNYADAVERGTQFTLIDTGGFDLTSKDDIMAQVREQATIAIEDADVIVFVMDGRTGPTAQDTELVRMLRKSGKPVLYAANKLDTPRAAESTADFYSLGISDVFGVSAEAGYGLNDLVDAIIERLPENIVSEESDERVKVAIVGRPNAGKSSLLNRLIGKKRSIVSEKAGTTRDSIDTAYELDGKKYLFIDTAGIRRKGRISRTVEGYCVMEAIRSIERSDVAILVIDGKAGSTVQDESIAAIIDENKRGCIIVVNKWDLVEKETMTTAHVTDTLRERLPFLAFAPVVFTSALTGQRVTNIFSIISAVVDQNITKVTTGRLNAALEMIVRRHRPASFKGKEVKFYYAAQTGVSPPSFLIFTNRPNGVEESYRRYLANGLREHLGLELCPIRLSFRSRHES